MRYRRNDGGRELVATPSRTDIIVMMVVVLLLLLACKRGPPFVVVIVVVVILALLLTMMVRLVVSERALPSKLHWRMMTRRRVVLFLV